MRDVDPDEITDALIDFAATHRQRKEAAIANFAWEALENGVRGFQHSYDSQKERGMNLTGLKRHAEAVAAFERAVALTDDPGEKEFWYEAVGIIAATQLGDIETALDAAAKIRKLNPESKRAQYVHSEACREALKRLDRLRALQLCNEFLDTQPDEEFAQLVREKMENAARE